MGQEAELGKVLLGMWPPTHLVLSLVQGDLKEQSGESSYLSSREVHGVLTVFLSSALCSNSLETGWYSTNGKAGLQFLDYSFSQTAGVFPEQPRTQQREDSNSL